MTTELEMKEALDGFFFVYNAEKQAVTCRRVSKNHIPSHKPRIMEEDDKPKTAYPWKQSEDDLLVELRHRNLSWREVSKYMKLSPSCLRNRYLELCLKRGIKEHHLVRPVEVQEIELRVIALRENDKTFHQIAEMLGLTRNQVAGIVQRVRRRQGYLEEAA